MGGLRPSILFFDILIKEVIFKMYVLLFLFWLLINGKITIELVIIGLILCAIVYLFSCLFLKFSPKKDLIFCKNLYLIVAFMFMLVIEVVKSNLNIITLIWSNKAPDPVIVKFNVELKTSFLRVLFANAITLTPGTITISLTKDEFVVHALRSEYIEGIEESVLLKILKKMEGDFSW